MNRQPLDVDAVRRDLTETTFPIRADGPERYGMEVEVFPLAWSDRPAAVPLEADDGSGLIAMVESWAEEAGLEVVRPGAAPSGDGSAGRFTFEPGGQVEFSCAPMESPRAAWEATAAALDGLERELGLRGLRMISTGANPWQGAGEVALQTRAPRYECMAAYFASIGPAGEHMMRRTGAAHVNVDLGGAEKGARRWRGAQLLSPVAVATFGFSPVERGRASGWRSLRARSWLRLDPSRTGFPEAFVEGSDDEPIEQYLQFALEARVMMLRGEPAWRPVLEPTSFREWMECGIGGVRPDLDDWRYHLTTLFPEVRPKGFLELRSGDAQAKPFRAVPLVWWTALLCDDAALAAVLSRLGGTAAELPERRARAAESGCSDPEIRAEVQALWEVAAAAVSHAPADFYGAGPRADFAAFGELFATRGRAPADDVLAICAERGAFTPDAWDALLERWADAAGSREPC